ncbi:hypothetical protein PCANC_05278 [Puccinia coronata f. sp. avenae]|uniref:Uncharacterized protein n=1 Tax=Puccinia coronata f. sp. avenae TaxID=200324 RepID=A0A2N5VYT8_9BASI|nr:hypothetical protein PCANC_05278 [Puccinia coronata f. sp. avenae]
MAPPNIATSQSESISGRREYIGACYRVISDLFQKYRCDDIPCSIKPIVFIDTDKERWDDALNRLQFEILPPIRQPLHTLLESLHPSNHQAIKFLIMIFSQAFSRVWSRV